MTTTTLAVLVPLLPFLGAVAGLLTGRTAAAFVRPLAVLPTLAAFVLAVLVAARQGGGRAVDAATELTPTGSVPIELALHIDGFAALVAVLVGLVATCVQIYSTGYLRDDPRYPSYAALVSLFTSAMLLVVYSGDLMVLLVGWEVMGICSYFLVGHYWETPQARAASLKAFLVTKLGDVPFLIGLFALAGDAGSFRITKILGAVASDGGLDHPTVIALLLLAGVAGKSAQFPLHTWLPDAMAGPTPVSALIHAATMVAAGVYFTARLLPVFEASDAAMLVLAVMAAVTMTGSALAALAQDDIKRVLAYSTIGQLGYLTGALAVADRGAAVFHLLSHGAFKALLFLAAGVLIHAAGTNSLAAMSRTRGLRDRVPDAYWTMTVALLALAAIPPFSGFFSKESVLAAAEHVTGGHTEHAPAAAGWTVLVAGLLTALLTAAYATRLWLLAFRGRGTEAPGHGRQPVTMNAVLWVLAIPSLAFGGLAFRLLPDWFDGRDLTPTLTTSVLGTGVALVGGIVTYGAWRHTTALTARVPLGAVAAHPEGDAGAVEAEAIASHAPAYGDIARAPDPADPGRLLLGPLHRHAAAGFHLDAVYAALLVRPVLAGASLVRFLDREVVDAYVRGAGALPRVLGAAVRRAQTGNVQTYVSALLAGTVVLAVAAVLVATGA
ncbi:NADH-quinone oxidoreductase subunit 5 family protein [Streptomyces griseoviridis]|uniref:NADH-quinone oxidoreductase subunit L n=1 Tax=Streptomyces griseoviridis TaxID=45398 RepID=A0ABT9LIG2_STRGD|nr:NADH-quinone oxidoreductase subunit L [Streptomyces griseoviridis]MDP9683488.1 NADH-quinone oxidoreductase subunit L [Streptomyces griseoviridis]GGS94680.1 NADH dehydrogenase [Streptomyces griseoviridis]